MKMVAVFTIVLREGSLQTNSYFLVPLLVARLSLKYLLLPHSVTCESACPGGSLSTQHGTHMNCFFHTYLRAKCELRKCLCACPKGSGAPAPVSENREGSLALATLTSLLS